VAGSNNGFNDLLNLVPRLQVRDNVSELSGGLTNINLKVSTPTGDYVARISSNKSSLLSIDRQAEFENSKIAAQIGIGAPIYDFLPDFGLLVIGYLEGKTFTASDVATNLARVAKSVKKLHSAKPFVRDFDMFEIQQNYLNIVTQRGFKLPEKYQDYAEHLNQMKAALAVLDEGKVSCNNDLLAANFIDDGDQIWLIDYEYSGNNDACFELGNIYSESELSYEQLVELVDNYYGKHRPEKVARAWLFALLARYGWSLWASIQNSISEIDFDFWAWGMQKYERACLDFSSTQFKSALTQVATKSN
jgi:thiamine kinase-like enzyme